MLNNNRGRQEVFWVKDNDLETRKSGFLRLLVQRRTSSIRARRVGIANAERGGSQSRKYVSHQPPHFGSLHQKKVVGIQQNAQPKCGMEIEWKDLPSLGLDIQGLGECSYCGKSWL